VPRSCPAGLSGFGSPCPDATPATSPPSRTRSFGTGTTSSARPIPTSKPVAVPYPPRPDGRPTFNEGYLFDGDGDLIPARVVEAPWLTKLQPLGEDVSVVLQTADGSPQIEGEVVFSTHDITDPSEIPADQLAKLANWTFPALQQAGVRYRWDGEETYGMLERSIPMDKITR
jgi:cell wall-associated NlpC family hydrolase